MAAHAENHAKSVAANIVLEASGKPVSIKEDTHKKISVFFSSRNTKMWGGSKPPKPSRNLSKEKLERKNEPLRSSGGFPCREYAILQSR